MTITILTGCCLSILATLPSQSIHTCITSPPYWGLRDYGQRDQLGLESTPDEYVANMVKVFREVRRVLRDDGTLWLNLGDSYARAGGWSDNSGLDGLLRGESGHAKSNMTGEGVASQKLAPGLKSKDLVGIPWRVAFALQADGWYLRSDIIWSKPNPMPEPVTDRPTKAHEYLFLLSKSDRYYYDHEAIAEPASGGAPGNVTHKGKTAYEAGDHKMRTKVGLTEIGPRQTRNRRSVWTVATKPFSEAHFATYPPELIEPCILAGATHGGTVLDPFFGAGTTGLVADRHGRHCIGIELNPEYVTIAESRLRRDAGMFADIVVAA